MDGGECNYYDFLLKSATTIMNLSFQIGIFLRGDEVMNTVYQNFCG